MKAFIQSILILSLLFIVGAAQARPLEVIYNDKVTTKFNWKWPYQTRQTKTYVQTKPYFYTGRVINVANENVSKYRFYYTQRTCMNKWGYFFRPNDKLCSKQALTFAPPQSINEVHIVPKY